MSFWKFLSFCTYLHRRGGLDRRTEWAEFYPLSRYATAPLKKVGSYSPYGLS